MVTIHAWKDARKHTHASAALALRRVPDRAGDRVAARSHLIVNLYRREFPADPVVGASHGESGLRQRALVCSHTGRGLFKGRRESVSAQPTHTLIKLTDCFHFKAKQTSCAILALQLKRECLLCLQLHYNYHSTTANESANQ